MAQWETHDFHAPIPFGSGGDKITATYVPIAHILGAGAVRFIKRGADGHDRVLVCTGDVGNSPDTLLPEPEPLTDADYLITESVYGDRLHGDTVGRSEKLRKEIIEADRRGGTLLIPSFAVHRTQSLLYEINKLT
jgi:metallo-beta-lactamase family protein